jgi:hypothetical protein
LSLSVNRTRRLCSCARISFPAAVPDRRAARCPKGFSEYKYNFPSIVRTLVLNETTSLTGQDPLGGEILTDGIERLSFAEGLSYCSVSYTPSTTERRKIKSRPPSQFGNGRNNPPCYMLAHEENNAANHSPYRFSSASVGCTANMALQHGVGLLSERRTGSGPADSPCSSHREKDLSVAWYGG